MTFRSSIYKAILATGMAGSLAVGLFVQGRPAFAYTPNASGQPGLVQVPFTQGSFTGSGSPTVTFPTRYVWRSNAYSATQLITVSYRLWKYNATSGQWPKWTSAVVSAQVAPGAPGAWVSGWYFPLAFDSYSADVLVEWKTLDGQLIGWKNINYTAAGDYQCLTASTCSVLPNTSVGAFIYLHPAPRPVATPQPTPTPVVQPTGNSFTVGGDNPDLGVSPGTGGSHTIVISPSAGDTNTDAVDRIYFRDLYYALHGPHGNLYPTSLMDSLVNGIVTPANALYDFGTSMRVIVPW